MAASLPVIKPLDGGDGYLRWKESVLLHLHTAGVAHVLSEAPPTGGGGGAASPEAAAERRKWARDDAVCRGHILAALSDSLLPDYARHATAGDLWRALARTYDLAVSADSVSYRRFHRFRFDDGAPLLEQLAHAEALGAFAEAVFPGAVAELIRASLPAEVRARIPAAEGSRERISMDTVWRYARIREEVRMARVEDDLWEEAMARDPEGHRCKKRRRSGHVTRNCTGAWRSSS